MHSFALVASLTSLAFSIACNNARDAQEKASNAQAEATEKISEISRDANKKVVEAQAEADKKTAEARADFLKLRENYRHEVTNKLVALDKKIADLEAKANTSAGQKKLELEARLQEIRRERDAFVNDYRGIEAISADAWDTTKKNLETAWSRLESLVDRT